MAKRFIVHGEIPRYVRQEVEARGVPHAVQKALKVGDWTEEEMSADWEDVVDIINVEEI